MVVCHVLGRILDCGYRVLVRGLTARRRVARCGHEEPSFAPRVARQFGGTGHVDVRPGHKIIGATWKGADLWVLTRPMRPGDEPETLSLREFSSWGAIEGEMLLREVDSQETAREAGR